MFRARQLMGWRLRLSDKTVRTFAELPIYCQRQKCSPGNVVSGSVRFMQIFADVPWGGGVKWELGRWKWRFSLLSFTVFQTFYMATRQLSSDATVDDLDISRSLDCFTSISEERCVIWQKLLSHTLAFDWCHFWWPWSTFEGHFHVHFSNLSQAIASRRLPAIAELLVIFYRATAYVART